MILHSESDKRLIVKGKLNDKDVSFLVDTGAATGLIHRTAVKKYGLNVNKNHSVNLVGAGGDFKAYLCNTPLVIANRTIYQFLIADISDVVNSIKRQTGIEIAGIIGLNQMKMMGISIDTDDNYIEIGNNG